MILQQICNVKIVANSHYVCQGIKGLDTQNAMQIRDDIDVNSHRTRLTHCMHIRGENCKCK